MWRVICVSESRDILLLDILKVLYKYTDANEGKTIIQKELIEAVEAQGGYEDLYDKRNTVKDNVNKLIDYFEKDFPGEGKIAYKAKYRKYNDRNRKQAAGEERKKMESAILYDFAYRHLFTHAELRLIIDSILFSKQIPAYQREDLIKRIERLASEHFDSRIGHIKTLSGDGPINYELFDTIEVLNRAMDESKKVSFYYDDYTVDKGSRLVLEARKDSEGRNREYIINPYQMVAANGRYYLVCNHDRYDNVSHYRLDRISDIEILHESRKSMKEVEELEHGLNLPKHMAEHIYMFSGESVHVRLRFKKRIINEFVDWFGKTDIKYTDQTEDEVTANVKVNRMAIRKWALQYGLHVRVLSPQSLVDEVKEDIGKAMKNYE